MSERKMEAMNTPDINETEYQPKAAPDAAYPLNATDWEVPIKHGNKIVVHRLRKPTLDELVKREEMAVYETEEVEKFHDKLDFDSEAANIALWDKIALQVKGYRIAGHDVDEWVDVDDALKSRIYGSDKHIAIEGMYSSACFIETGDEDEGVSLDGGEYIIRQEIGRNVNAPDYVVRHVLRQPTESERLRHKRKASSTFMIGGSKRRRVRIKANLRESVELYDKLFMTVYGVTGVESDNLLRHIDPLWKRQVVVALMQTFESSLSD